MRRIAERIPAVIVMGAAAIAAWFAGGAGTVRGEEWRAVARPALRIAEQGESVAPAASLIAEAAGAAEALVRIDCEGAYPRHLQGIALDAEAIYWCFTTELVKTDRRGKRLRHVPVANHHGDLCHHDGKLYVAVNLGQFNQPAGKADSWVYVYRADDLSLLARHRTPEVVHGAGGVGYREGRLVVVGGLPPGTEENYVYEYDADFRFLRRHVLPSGYTYLGIQTAAFAHGRWWFGCYGDRLLAADPQFRLLGTYRFDGALGIAGLPEADRLLVAGGPHEHGVGCTGWARAAVVDAEQGLRWADP